MFYVSLAVMKRGKKPVVIMQKTRIQKSKHIHTKASKHTKRQQGSKQDLKKERASLGIRGMRLHMSRQGAWVRSDLRELRSHILCITAKRLKKFFFKELENKEQNVNSKPLSVNNDFKWKQIENRVGVG